MSQSKKSKEINVNDVQYGDLVLTRFGIGEVIQKIDEGYRITSKEQDEHQKEYDDNFYKGKGFVKVFPEMIPMLEDKLTSNEFAFLFQLIPYVSYKDNILRHNGRILDMKDLSEIMKNYTYDAVRKIIPSLIKKGVLGVHKTGCADKPNVMIKCYTVNPHIIGKGNTINRTITGLFEKSGWNKI